MPSRPAAPQARPAAKTGAGKAPSAVKPVKPVKPTKPAKVAKAVDVKAKAPVTTGTPVAAPAPAKAPSKRAAAPKTAKKAPAAAKPPKPKAKLVRDSFTMPQADFALVGVLKDRALEFKRPTKKSELLRAGLQALAKLDAAALSAALGALTPLKPGRPKQGD